MDKKRKIWWGIGLVVVLGLVIWLANFAPQIYERWQQQRYLSQVEALKDQYRQDKYGGATPEETLKMFVEAFKAGDLELASKYFIPEKQAEYLTKMENWVKVGKREEIISVISKASWSGNSHSEQDQVDVWGENNESVLNISFFKNPYTLKWKLNNM